MIVRSPAESRNSSDAQVERDDVLGQPLELGLELGGREHVELTAAG